MRLAVGWIALGFFAVSTVCFAQSPFSVGDLTLGAAVEASVVKRGGFQCAPSLDYPAFAWCKKLTKRKRDDRVVNVSSTLVLGQDGAIAYVGEETSPVALDDKTMKAEIDKISERFKLAARRFPTIVGKSGTRSSVLVTWGDLTLAPLDPQKRKLLVAGMPPRAGVLVDMLGNFAQSARKGLPLYRLEGGAGFIWEAIFEEKGGGRIRLSAADPSRLTPSKSALPIVASVDCSSIADGIQRLRCYDDAAAKDKRVRSPAEIPNKARWFFGKLGLDTCVPIDQVDAGTLKKLAGRNGTMLAPSDVARVFRAVGDDVTEVPAADGVVALRIGPAQGADVITLFDGEQRCAAAMGKP